MRPAYGDYICILRSLVYILPLRYSVEDYLKIWSLTEKRLILLLPFILGFFEFFGSLFVSLSTNLARMAE